MGTMSIPFQIFFLSVVILTCTHIGATEDNVATLSAAVHEILLPIMKEIKYDLNSVKDDLNSVKNDLGSLNKTVSDIMRDLSSLNDSANRISDNVEAHENHMTTELMKLDQNLQKNFTLQLKNSFGYLYPVHTCGDTGGWRRVVYLNFTDPNTPCPSGWKLTNHSKRTCSRTNTSAFTCDSVTFPVSGGDYTRVCGRIIAYQYWSTDAFWAYDRGDVTTIGGPYADGVSLTHGSPRKHIWTFAAGHSEKRFPSNAKCPCDTPINITIPPFVGGDYFCESGRQQADDSSGIFYSDDPLWDGDGCNVNSTCCSFNNPPNFTKQLSSPTADDIEARLCHSDTIHSEDTPIEFIELYVQQTVILDLLHTCISAPFVTYTVYVFTCYYLGVCVYI